MHPREVAGVDPGKVAIVMVPSGTAVTYAQLTERSNRGAQLFRSLGLEAGDGIALCMENHPGFFDVCWAAHNAGLYYTPVSSRLHAEEAAYIIRDCGARVLVVSAAMCKALSSLPALLGGGVRCFTFGAAVPGFESYDSAIAGVPAGPLASETQGIAMVYSSGTTGHPKGIKAPLPNLRVDEPAALPTRLIELYGFDAGTVYFSPAPLYHAAPLKYNMTVMAAGGTCIIMEKFDAELAVDSIGRHRVTHSQWVPTMFIRLLGLPDEVRARYDGSSHRFAIHAAAPCPVDVKLAMLEWWGPIVYEYYSGSESIGMCAIGPQEWLRHRGSVGKAVRGDLHIVAEDGRELPPGETGLVYFANCGVLRYHNDPAKTARAHNDRGWATIGDIGHVDEEGYLYLTDRRDYVINSGGVNIYPQEAENLLSVHPKILDVAVFGIPNREFGEEVKAVAVLRVPEQAGAALEQELIGYCRQHLSPIKCPKSVDFAAELPREPTGKLVKKRIRDTYWKGTHEQSK
jgi:acyl-CoA synthetase (AMP-forming)/AMP-acid ligase II